MLQGLAARHLPESEEGFGGWGGPGRLERFRPSWRLSSLSESKLWSGKGFTIVLGENDRLTHLVDEDTGFRWLCEVKIPVRRKEGLRSCTQASLSPPVFWRDEWKTSTAAAFAQ